MAVAKIGHWTVSYTKYNTFFQRYNGPWRYFNRFFLLLFFFCFLFALTKIYRYNWSRGFTAQGSSDAEENIIMECHHYVLLLGIFTYISRSGMMVKKGKPVLQTTFSNEFYWMKVCGILLKFHWNAFRKFKSLTSQHQLSYANGLMPPDNKPLPPLMLI